MDFITKSKKPDVKLQHFSPLFFLLFNVQCGCVKYYGDCRNEHTKKRQQQQKK